MFATQPLLRWFRWVVAGACLITFSCASWDRRLQPAKHAMPRRTNSNYPSKRADLCERVRALHNGSITLREALRGVKLSGAVTLWDADLLGKDNKTGEWSGLHYELMRELSKRAGFSFELHEHPFPTGMGWTTWLLETVDLYDVSVDYWQASGPRLAAGAFPVNGLLDTSTKFAAHAKPVEKEVDWLSFMKPLQNDVWIVLVVLAVITALVYVVIEWNANPDDLMDEQSRIAGFGQSVFLSLFTITGAGTFTPKTWPGKIVAFSWAWCIMLFVSAYTANLAAFLVTKPRSITQYASLDEALSANAKICVWKGTPQDDYIQMRKKSFPQYTGDVRTTEHPMLALRNGDCVAALGAAVELDTAVSSKAMNPCCSLTEIGPPLTLTEGAWMVKNDYVDTCTSLVRDVLYSYGVDLDNEGFIDELYEQYRNAKSDEHCASDDVIAERCPNGMTPTEDGDGRRLNIQSVQEGSTRQLKAKGKASAAAGAVAESEEQQGMELSAMAGMYLVHGILLGLGLVWWVGQKGYDRFKGKFVSATPAEPDEGSADDKSVQDQLRQQGELLQSLSKSVEKQTEVLRAIRNGDRSTVNI